MPDLSTMPRAKLLAYQAKWAARHLADNRALIEACRGHEDCRDTLAKTDPLALAFRESFEAWHAAVDELSARRRYHGSEHPIRRRA